MTNVYDEAALSRRERGRLVIELTQTVGKLKAETNRRAKLPLVKRMLEIVKILKGNTSVKPVEQEQPVTQEVTKDQELAKDKKVLVDIKEKKHPLMTSPDLREVISEILKKYEEQRNDASLRDMAVDMVNTCMEAIDAWAEFVEDYIKTETNGAVE